MTKEEICNKVRAAIDALAHTGTGSLTMIDDQENLDALIIDKIPYAKTFVLLNAASDLLEDAAESLNTEDFKENEDYSQERGGVWKVRLPENTMRVLTARLKTWMKAPMPVSESSPVALMQLDRYARGSWDRPVVILRREGSRLWLEFYSGKGTETVNDIVVNYVATPSDAQPDADASGTGATQPDGDASGTGATQPGADASGTEAEISIPAKLEAAFIYEIAGLVCTAMREDISGSLFAIANKYLGIAQEGD